MPKLRALLIFAAVVLACSFTARAFAEDPTPTATPSPSPTATPLPAPSLTIIQDTIPETSGVRFYYDAEPTSLISDFRLTDDAAKVFSSLAPGRYSLTQRSTEGYVLSSIRCRGDYYPDTHVSLSTSTLRLNLRAGDQVVCTFTNAPQPTPVPTTAPTETATPTPTQTPAPVATPTPPAPVTVFIPVPGPVQTVEVVREVAAPAAPVPATPTIRPPSTGDGGLLH